MKVSVLQYEITPGRRKDHLLRLLALAEEAEGDLLVAPELAITGYGSEPTSDIPTEIIDFVQRTGKPLLLGHPVKIGDAFRNAAFLVSPERSLAVAEKEILFPGLDEEAGFVPGDRKRVFQVGGISAGVLLCYEVRFPEIARRLVSRGTALLFVLAEWPAKRYAHLRALATARAIENQVFVIVANALGRAGELGLAGESFVVSPAGEILGELGKEEGVLTVELDPEALSEARKLFNTSARRPPEPPEGKILALTEAVEEVRRRRALGHRMVFTNGCFDLLHAGHVSYLYEARRLGDFLVVGLNADESVRRLKGPERPINSQKERALVLASLACVDYVVLFEEDTPERLIQTLEPDVLVKGADWPEDKIVGADFVKSRGGRVVRLPFKYKVSTTSLVERIRRG